MLLLPDDITVILWRFALTKFWFFTIAADFTDTGSGMGSVPGGNDTYINNDNSTFVLVSKLESANFIKHFWNLSKIASLTVTWAGMFNV